MADVDEECELTTEQKDFLEECLVEFAHRYTDEDEEYKRVYEDGISTPPIMTPWHGRPKLTANRSGNRNSHRQYDRDRHERDRHDRDRSDRDRHDRDRDRDHYESRYPRNERNDGHKRYRPY